MAKRTVCWDVKVELSKRGSVKFLDIMADSREEAKQIAIGEYESDTMKDRYGRAHKIKRVVAKRCGR